MNNSEELLDVYGEDGIETGEVMPKSEIHKYGVLHRIAEVWLYNGSGGLMLQKRALAKKLDPGKWAVVSGHIGTQEESKIAAARELREEMGIERDPEELLFLGSVRHTEYVADDFIENEILDVYVTGVTEDPEDIKSNNEVLEAKYFTVIDLENQYATGNPQFAYRPDSFTLIKEFVYGPGQI
jgi:isopentenyl-diphosphate Delta-isomerase